MTIDHSGLLARIPMFAGLDAGDLAVLATSLVERRVARGTMIVQQGERGHSMFIVASGEVNIHLPCISLENVGDGGCFGELALFDDKPRSASAIATMETVLLELDRDTLERCLAARPHAAMSLLRATSARLRETNDLLSQRVAKNALEEVEQHLTWSQRLADKVADLNGSWAFILGLLAVSLGWVVINMIKPFDAYPYVFFNLILAILGTLQGPLIVMSQNRSAIKDRAQAETDFKVNLKNEVNIETLLREVGKLRAQLEVGLVTRPNNVLRHEA